MKQSKWPDYLFSVAVRFVFGGIFGAVGGLLFLVSGRHPMALHLGGHNALMLIVAAFVLGALIGSIGAVLTIPDWQTPWYNDRR
jgi:DMSO reductase anchor subunit